MKKKLTNKKAENQVTINGWDFDGVISIGMYPGPNDFILTGRCIDEVDIVNTILTERGIDVPIIFNPMKLEERGTGTVEARTHSGNHKARMLNELSKRVDITYFFEDDEIQAEIIKRDGPKSITLIKIDSPTEK